MFQSRTVIFLKKMPKFAIAVFIFQDEKLMDTS